MTKAVYVAGGSSELELVESYIARLREAGVPITHDWTKVVRANGHGNPREASREQRAEWAKEDLYGVDVAALTWLILPATPSFGAGVEIGYALASPVCARTRAKLIVSGDTASSIFTALADHEFASHAEALAFVIEEAKR